MAKVYQVITGNWLHRSKRIFETIEESVAHIKMIVDMKKEWVSSSQALMSYHITEIDSDELPEYKKIFKEYSEIREPDGPRKKAVPKVKVEAEIENLPPSEPVDQKTGATAPKSLQTKNKSTESSIEAKK